MHSKINFVILALPIIGWNTFGSFTSTNGLQPFNNGALKVTDFVNGVKVLDIYSAPFQISARDDRIKDCLRSGNCKN